MSSKEVKRGITARATFTQLDADGAVADATVFPTVRQVTVNGIVHAGLSAAAEVKQVKDADGVNVTGQYEVSVPTAGLNYNDDIVVYITSEQDGAVCDTERNFTVSSDATRRPVLR